MSGREEWLHGWPLSGGCVLIGPSVHCCGCGKNLGLTTIAFDEAYQVPSELPDWPFEEDHCPVCAIEITPPTLETLAHMPLEILRKAVSLVKSKQVERGSDFAEDMIVLALALFIGGIALALARQWGAWPP